MKTIVLTCETIAEEVKLAAHRVKSDYPILWIQSGLHNFPGKLKEQIQAEIDRIANVEYILLLFGYCGYSLLDLVSGNSSLVIPRVDDCISLLLGGNLQRNRLNNKETGYFLTRGWLQHENNLWSEYTYCLNKYGPERTRQIYNVILHNYKYLYVINTGAYDLDKLLPETKKIAAELGLRLKVVQGSLNIIYKAFRGEWDHDFAVIEPGRPVSLQNLGIIETIEQSGQRFGSTGL